MRLKTKTCLPLLLSAALLWPMSSASASGAFTITGIDIVTRQGNGFYHPQQVALERSLASGEKRPERIRYTDLSAQSVFGMAPVAGTNRVYVTDRADGTIWEVDPDSGREVRHFAPSSKPSNNLQGIATGAGDDLFVYYNGEGRIQRLHKDGTVVDSWAAPTIYGHNMTYVDGYLYLLTDRGEIYVINAANHGTARQVQLKKPDGSAFSVNDTFGIMYDGAYWNIVAAGDNDLVYRYDANWNFHDKVDLKMWTMTGLVWNGREYYALNFDKRAIFTIRVQDDDVSPVEQAETDHYQYLGNLMTTKRASEAYPQYDDRNVLLLYNDPLKVTADYLKPYASYLDKSGKRAGNLFDSFLFLPSGPRSEELSAHVDQWGAYLSKSITDMKALEQEWGNHNADLKQTGKARVWISVPYPNEGLDLATREKTVHSYMDQAYQAIHDAGFKNLEFRGFYWYNETANHGDPLVVDFNQYAHAKGLLTMWIPYQSAGEAVNFKEFGFDEVFHQPNYYPFKDYNFAPNLNRFYNLAWTGARFGKGVELEMDPDILGSDSKYRERFNEYLHYGLEQGWLNASKAFYENGAIKALRDRQDPLYDTIYQALNGKYSDSSVNLLTPTAGNLSAHRTLSLPGTAKLRLDVLSDQPTSIQKVIVHTDDRSAAPMTYIGTLRADEELAVQGGKLVKQDLGGNSESLQLGFNLSLNDPVQVSVVPDGQTPFVDVASDNPAVQSILDLTNRGVLNGMLEDGQLKFQPDGQITRAQFAVMLTNAYGLKAGAPVTFGDSVNSWFSPYVAAVAENGFMSGYDAGTFGPDDPITQEQAAAILVRVLHRQNQIGSTDGVTIANQESVSDWALQQVLEGKQLGLYSDNFGYTGFDPQLPATRADVADVLYRALAVQQ
ncbi:DUF4855 domain-containing protein [Tumebacillus flagellatus]|uniref:SLH domain-containing protein n=1 Tax=Tumebacillus flagellatus TaxID=1157490 RepID=A0A074LR15_9BACL|nr:DUF4855 domain-containing protein [Tumebacillus flagellatus]KEO82263.1 hypothetical protein EL26_16570 [Tumebacillus flagellatus]